MGRNSPALAAALTATIALVGLTQVGVSAPQAAEPVSSTTAAGAPRAAALVAAPVRVTPAVAAPAQVVRTAVRSRSTRSPCSAGLIAMTFDDGPSPTMTPKLVRMLVRLKVPATFFMVGSRVEAHPEVARMVQASGFTIANHSWSHPQLTHLSNPEIRDQLRATTGVFKRHDVAPSRLMRPPFGAINDRVRRVIRELGMIPVLWSNDSLDWSGGDRVQIAHRILSALRPHGTNLVLQHDGVDNSPASVAAVPLVVRVARERGFCFTHLGPTGSVGGKVVTAPKSTQVTRPAPRKPSATGPLLTASGPIGLDLRTSQAGGFRVLFSSRAGMVVPRPAYLRDLMATLRPRH